MQHFYAIAHKDEGSAFGLIFPSVPGLFAAAEDLEGLVPAAIEALSLWFEDTEFVAPASLDTVSELGAADLADGAFLVAVPWPQSAGLC